MDLRWRIPCGECGGMGELTVGGADPYKDRLVRCGECSGSGLMDSEEAGPEEVLEGARISGDTELLEVLTARFAGAIAHQAKRAEEWEILERARRARERAAALEEARGDILRDARKDEVTP